MLASLYAAASTWTLQYPRLHSLLSGVYWRLFVLLALSVCLSANAAASTSPAAPAAVQVCAACHGAQGAGNASGTPRLAGMDPAYLAHSLNSFKNGKRPSNIMQPIARTLSDADIDALAKYFAAQKTPLIVSPQAPSPEMVAAGKAMALHGDGNGVPACFSCHAMNGRGNGVRYPGIASQPETYLVNRLHEFQARARAGTPKPGSMTEVASKLTEAEIDDVAAYLSVIPPK
ncbi:c-type cytochrome [Dyella flava]|uniref:Cytochrome c4 n=1 Tax=Dyella flava TaxID=1920170 RepID=A0ABS2K2I2_9GAMM|nr:c-type cytochrome [Dyella flava]MBM7124870.1 cytochrome c4 [Dyella flava]GLQ50911.1 hypothetical protein GCM10010872_23600 [Dyella flava]